MPASREAMFSQIKYVLQKDMEIQQNPSNIGISHNTGL